MSTNKLRSHNNPESSVTSSNIFFCVTNSPKPPNFMVVNYKEKQQTLIFKNLDEANVWHFCLKMI